MQLQLNKVSKRYSRTKYGLQDFSLTIDKGIIGLLGANGAGKSTLLKMIATVSKPSEGMITFNKNNISKDPNYMRKQLGYVPQDVGAYPNLNAFEFLSYVAALKGVGGSNVKHRIETLLEGLNLTVVAKKPIKSYSGGMKQRVGIAQALLNDPKVLLLDEPTVGLDPEERVRFRDLISELANDSIVLLSSHIVSDIDTIADRVVVMKEGHLVAEGTPMSLIEVVQDKVFESTIEREQLQQFKNQHLVVSTSRKEAKLKIRFISKTPVNDAAAVSPTLEDAYLYLTKNH